MTSQSVLICRDVQLPSKTRASRLCISGTLAVWCVLANPPLGIASQSGEVLEAGRPVQKAMVRLAGELGWNISYEDPPYVNPDDMRDVTVREIDGQRAIIPRGGRITLPDDVAARAGIENPVALLESVLATEQTARGNVKRFRILRSRTMFHVIPTKFLNAEGRWQPLLPVLDSTVSLSSGEMSLLEFLQELCAQITESSGTKVVGGVAPMLGVTTRLKAQERQGRARDLLVEALATTGTPHSWLLLYDIPRRAYFLHIVRPGLM